MANLKSKHPKNWKNCNLWWGNGYLFSGPLLKMLEAGSPHQQSPFSPLASQSLALSLLQRLPEMNGVQQIFFRDFVNSLFL